jgi:uncharacterized membrane protein
VTERSTRRDPGRERLRVTAGTRAAVSIGTGAVVAVAATVLTPWQVALLLGWDAAMAVYVSWVWLGVGHLDPETTRRVAVREDSSRAAADIVLILANVMNLVGVTLALLEASGRSRLEAGLINGAVVLSIGLSWTAVHTVFALRYARLYYERDGGVEFPTSRPTTPTSRTWRSRSG